MMKEDQTYKVPFDEQKQQALKDYKTISERACHWSGFIQAAIEAYQDPMKDEASMKSIYDKALANNYYSEDAAFEAMTEWAKREISKLAVEEVAIPITQRSYSEQDLLEAWELGGSSAYNCVNPSVSCDFDSDKHKKDKQQYFKRFGIEIK